MRFITLMRLYIRSSMSFIIGVRYAKAVIPAQAGIQNSLECTSKTALTCRRDPMHLWVPACAGTTVLDLTILAIREKPI